jgi:hypothetical protein
MCWLGGGRCDWLHLPSIFFPFYSRVYFVAFVVFVAAALDSRLVCHSENHTQAKPLMMIRLIQEDDGGLVD